MSGVEIKPGIWINPDHIAFIKVSHNREAFSDAHMRYFRARRDIEKYLEKTVKQFGEGSPEHLKMKEAVEEQAKSYPRPDPADFDMVFVSMINGGYHYWVDTDLQETLSIVGWADGTRSPH